MRTLFETAWQRFNVISSVVGDASAGVISTLFYFTVLVPFGIGSVLFSDPLRRKQDPTWLEREPVPTDVASAKQQG